MTPLAAAFDNIRLIRRKLVIAEAGVITALTAGQRDCAVMNCVTLRDELARALVEFADAGFEKEVARLIEGRADPL